MFVNLRFNTVELKGSLTICSEMIFLHTPNPSREELIVLSNGQRTKRTKRTSRDLSLLSNFFKIPPSGLPAGEAGARGPYNFP